MRKSRKEKIWVTIHAIKIVIYNQDSHLWWPVNTTYVTNDNLSRSI